jgi:hypothetical protein
MVDRIFWSLNHIDPRVRSQPSSKIQYEFESLTYVLTSWLRSLTWSDERFVMCREKPGRCSWTPRFQGFLGAWDAAMPLWKLKSDEILIKVVGLSSRDGDNVKHTALKSSAKLFQNGSHFLSF